jgi:glycine cleavage system H protein
MLFTEGHAWLKPEGDGHVRIGITDYAENSLGDVVFVSLPPVGGHFDAGHEIVVIESVKAADGIVMPVAGTIVAVNEALSDNPEKVNALTADERWFVVITPDHALLPANFMDEAAYQKLIG